MTKTTTGRFFEHFTVGETIHHATPRTVTSGDVALYTALYGSRFAVQSADAFANRLLPPALSFPVEHNHIRIPELA